MSRKAIVLVKAFSENVNSSLSNRDPRGRMRPYFYENPACAPTVNVDFSNTIDCVLSCGEKQLVMVLNAPILGNVLINAEFLLAVPLSFYAHSIFL